MHERTDRASSRSRTGRARPGGSARPARRPPVWTLFLTVVFLGAPPLRAQPMPDLEGGAAVVVTADHGATDTCTRLFRIRPLSAVGELPDSIADAGEVFLCLPSRVQVWRQVGTGDAARFERSEPDEIEVGAELDVWTRGATFPTNPPQLRADRIRIRPSAEPDADPMEP